MQGKSGIQKVAKITMLSVVALFAVVVGLRAKAAKE